MHLIDFGIAIRLRQDGVVAGSPAVLEGTLAYIAPEQTGRVNRGVDVRSDLYSLGVTLFEMLTGTLPFPVSDPGELLHCHIAQKPPSPRDLNAGVPEVLATIVLKLLNKMAEDRYQSARGLRHDLQECLHSWQTLHSIPPFVLGTHDRPSELRLPQKLYGQRDELAQLDAALERVRGGALELVLLSGAPGSGKTVLVSELARPLSQRGGYLARACFDQQQQSIPYGPLLGACRDLLRLLLTEPAHALLLRKERFLQALGKNGQILVELLPELELVIGPQPPVPALPAAESQNRFGLVFQNFLRQFASAQHPLVLFLDELHFADPASLQLVRLLLTDPYGHYLLVVGAWRKDQSDDTEALELLLANLHKEHVATTTIALKPLQLADVTELLSDALVTPPAALTELAREILIKTHGSPFFVHQFLNALYRDQRLLLDPATGEWQWDLASIQALTATDNVADFMIATLQRLGPQSLLIVQRAACIGTQFDLAALSVLCKQSPSECVSALAAAVHVGLLIPLDGTYHQAEYERAVDSRPDKTAAGAPAALYKFVHERVQQAAYAMLGESQQKELHLELGRLRLAALGPDAPTGQLFDLVHHLNLGSPLLTAAGDAAGLLELAQLNLQAGQRAKSTAAFHAAAGFFIAATTLLPESAWQSQHALMFELHYERAHCEILVAHFAEAEALLRALRKHASSPIEHGRVQLQLCEMYSTWGDFVAATQAAIEGLAELGVSLPLPSEDAHAAFLAERVVMAELIGQRSILELAALPLHQSPEISVALSILIAMNFPVYMTASPLYPLLMARQITLALQNGLGEQTGYACASYGFLLATMLGEFAESYKFGQLALAISQRIPNISMACRVHFALASYLHYCLPLKETSELYEKAEKAGLITGDFTYVSLSCSGRTQRFHYTREDLPAALREADEHMALMQRTKDALSTLQVSQTRQLLRALVGATKEPTSLSDADFDEEAVWQGLRQGKQTYGLNHLAWLKLTLLYLFGQHEAACALGIESEAWFAVAPGITFHTERIFLFCLALIAHYPSVPEEDRGGYDVRIDRYHQQLRTWAGSCAANFHHRERLVAAERARLAGQSAEATMLFDQAIDAAHRHGFPLHEALAHELAGRFHAAEDRSRLASYYLTEALYCYLHLGATPKANALVAAYPDHLRAETRTLKGLHLLEPMSAGTTSNTVSTRGAEDHLDVNMVLRAAEVISRELVLDKVIEQVLHTVLSSAGAQRGFLILDRGGTLQIEAARTLSPDTARMGLSIPLDNLVDSETPAEELACSVVHYVVRTRQVVALSADVADTRFTNDAYLLRVKPQAVLCLPLTNQGRLTGLLYLENNLAQVTFSAARIDLLRILAAQAATALENALLLHRVQEATEKIRRTNELLESQVAERTGEIQRSNTELQLTNQRLQVELAERGRAERERATLQEQMLQAERERARLQEQTLQAERDRAALQEQMLHAQRERLAELATPIIPITARIMVMPLIGAMEAERAGQLMDAALNGAQQSGAKVVILDITGLRHIDTSVADSLIKTARALRLIGAHAIITGIRAVVAQTLVSLGVDLGSMETRSTLQSAIAYALRHTGESLVLQSK